MTDINNNMGMDKIGKIQNIGFEGKKSASVSESGTQSKVVENLDNDHAAMVGRSMIKKISKSSIQKNFDKALVESIKSSLKELNSNPKAVKDAILIAQLAMKRGASEDQATDLALEFIEFHK